MPALPFYLYQLPPPLHPRPAGPGLRMNAVGLLNNPTSQIHSNLCTHAHQSPDTALLRC